MLIRYKNMHVKPSGCPIRVPVGLKSAALMKRAALVWAKPFAELPDQEALKLVALDPYNFELVKEGDAPIVGDPIPVAKEGLELDPDKTGVPPTKPKRKRRTRAQMMALKLAKEAQNG